MAEPQRDGRHVDAGLEQVHRGSVADDMRRHARTVPVAYPRRHEYVDEVVDPTTQRPGPDLVADAWANGKRFKHGLLLGPLTLGTRRDHAYYVKLAVAGMPATPGATTLG